MALFVAPRLVAVLLALVASNVNGQFLAPSPDVISRAKVVEQLQMLLGYDRDRERLNNVEGLLRPTFVAMPKNGFGSLEHRAARHALYRYFLVQHSWYVNGLALEMDEKNASSSSSDMLLKSQMPTFIIELLESQVRHQGIGLKDLAVLAATIEDLVRSEGLELLTLAYSTHGISQEDAVSQTDFDLILKTFLLYLILPDAQAYSLEPKLIKRSLEHTVTRAYPGWDEAVLWAVDSYQALVYQDRSTLHPFATDVSGQTADFDSMSRWATKVKAEWGRFADIECKAMKNKLIDLEGEEHDDGRVQLSQFYGPYLQNISFHFSEGPEYLRHAGALDDRHPRGPSVIVPNLMYSQTNCVSVSGFHSVCCIDHCEAIIGALEKKVVGPTALPAMVEGAVAMISSETVVAPRNLSSPLRQRLEAIAERHGGEIPLHGRLFSEWLHFAFPNECPYPRSLITKEAQMTRNQWEKKTKRDVKATQDEMVAALMAARNRTVLDESPMLAWSEDEELLGNLDSPSGVTMMAMLRITAGMLVLIASVHGLVSTARAGQLGGKCGIRTWFPIEDRASATHFV